MTKAKKFSLTELLNQRPMEETENGEPGRQEGKTGESVPGKEEIVMVDVRDLEPSRENFYQVDDSLKRSVELVGILQPLLVDPPRNGKYRVIAGHRRRLAVLALVEEGNERRRRVPCVIRKEDVKDRLALIMANRFRDKTDWEKMMEAVEAEGLAKELKKDYGLEGRTRKVLAELMGMSEAQLGRYKAIYSNLDRELMEEFRAGRISFSVASELCGMPGEFQKMAKEQIREKGMVSLPEIRELKREAVAREEAGEPGKDAGPEKVCLPGAGKSRGPGVVHLPGTEGKEEPGKMCLPGTVEKEKSGKVRLSGTWEKEKPEAVPLPGKTSPSGEEGEPEKAETAAGSGAPGKHGDESSRKKGPVTTGELFHGIYGRLKEKEKLPDILDYGLASSPSVPVTDGEFGLKASLDYGGSEGIYLDLWVEMPVDGETVRRGLGTFKTLEEDPEAMHTMARLLADFILEKYGYVRENRERFPTE